MVIKMHDYAYALLSTCMSSTKPFICLFDKCLVSEYYVPGIAEVLANMTDEFSPPGVYLLVGQPRKGQANE